MSRTPGGFYLLALCSGVFTLGMVSAMLALDPVVFDAEWRLLARGVVMVLAALAAITTEALWNARPWAARASTAFAVSFAAGMLLIVKDSPINEYPFVVGVLLFAALFIVPALLYIRARTRQLWPRHTAVRVAAPHRPTLP